MPQVGERNRRRRLSGVVRRRCRRGLQFWHPVTSPVSKPELLAYTPHLIVATERKQSSFDLTCISLHAVVCPFELHATVVISLHAVVCPFELHATVVILALLCSTLWAQGLRSRLHAGCMQPCTFHALGMIVVANILMFEVTIFLSMNLGGGGSRGGSVCH